MGNPSFGHFVKWASKYWINCLFHKMGKILAYFMKWAISQIGRYIYIYNYTNLNKTHLALTAATDVKSLQLLWKLPSFCFKLQNILIELIT